MRMIAILTKESERPFIAIKEVLKDMAPGSVFRNWKESLDEDAVEFYVKTLRPYYIFIHPVFGAVLQTTQLEGGGSDSAGDQLNYNMLQLCKAIEVDSEFTLSDEEFAESMKDFIRSKDDVVTPGYIYKCPKCGSTDITVISIGSIATDWREGKQIKRSADDVYDDDAIRCNKCEHEVSLKDHPDDETFHDYKTELPEEDD